MHHRCQIQWDEFTFGALIAACSSATLPGKAMQFLEAMPSRKVAPNAFVLGAAAAACVRGQQWQRGLELLTGTMRRLKLRQTTVTCGTAINACAVAALWDKALALLQELRSVKLQVNVVVLNSAMRGCERSGRWIEALMLLEDTKVLGADEVSWSCAMQSCAKAAHWIRALALFEEMPQRGLQQNLHATTAAIISGGLGGRWPYSLWLLNRLGASADVPAHAAAIGACEQSMQWQQALALLASLFQRSQEPNMACYNVAISACFKSGAWEQTTWLLKHLRDMEYPLDQLNSVALVEALGHSRCDEEARMAYRKIFTEKMGSL